VCMQPDDQRPGRDEEPRLWQPHHPARDFFSDWQEEEKEEDDNDEVATQPTVVLKKARKPRKRPLISDAHTTAPTMMNAHREISMHQELPPGGQAHDHTQQNEELFTDEDIPAERLDSVHTSAAHLMQLSGMMRAV